MNKTKKDNKDLPLPSGKMSNIYKKVIILFITMIIGLSALLMPLEISASIGYTPSYASVATVAEERENRIANVIDSYVNDLIEMGYVNPSWELNPLANYYGITLNVDLLNEESIEQAVLDNYEFYAEYISLTESKDTVYYFKTQQESDNFIIEINKYIKTSYEQRNVRKPIGAETPSSTLEKAIQKKKDQKSKQSVKRSTTINDRSGVAYDNAVVSYALQFVGNPYVYGGTSLTKGADCSGFTQSIYKNFGISLSRTVRGQASQGTKVSFSDIRPGDIVFYSGNGGKSSTHVGIYIGGSKIVHAATSSKGIVISNVNMMPKMQVRRVI